MMTTRFVLTSLRQRLFAALYDPLTAALEPELAALRQQSVGRLHGRVLEIGGGTGANLPYYADDVRLTVFEPNPSMAARLRRKAEHSGRRVKIDVADTARLPYPDASFEGVVASLVLCSVADQVATLREVRRVLRPKGEFVFLEHVVASDQRRRAWQRRLSPVQRLVADGCQLDRDTAASIRAAGFASTTIHEVEVIGLPALTRHMITGVAVAGRG